MKAVGWLAALLLRKAPEAAADVTTRLLNLPDVPPELAVQLVSAGMRFSYAQLLAAADSMVARVDVWVQAQQQLRVESNIPAAAIAICCNDNRDNIQQAIGDGHSADLLQLAMNCSSSATATAVIRCLPAAVAQEALREPDVARKLLLTAATRHHTAAVLHMACLPGMQQHVDAATLHAVLMQIQRTDDAHVGECAQHLCRLPAAQQLSSEAVLQLMRGAVPSSCFTLVALCGLPAAAHLTSEAVFGLFRSASGYSPRSIDVLSDCLPPMVLKRLSSQQMAQPTKAAKADGLRVIIAALRDLGKKLTQLRRY
uniref:Uncharacterized protein n=1 Tax=Tetradesmus obliquus TaxID=3088 RepID=A0A383VCN4_TETOB|eukprot:jgi/Sobl393_1/9036/SZX62482.1